MMNVHEILLPNVISSDSKERIKLLLNSKKGRAKFISKLDPLKINILRIFLVILQLK